jgi:hypothetical protein
MRSDPYNVAQRTMNWHQILLSRLTSNGSSSNRCLSHTLCCYCTHLSAYKATASVHWIRLAAVCKLHYTNMIHFDLQIGSLSVGPEADAQFVQLYVIFMNQLVTVLPITADIPKAYEQGSDDEQEFVQNLAIFLTGFLKVRHTPLLASSASIAFSHWIPAAQDEQSSAGRNQSACRASVPH